MRKYNLTELSNTHLLLATISNDDSEQCAITTLDLRDFVAG